jgi:ubiquinone/menaquinone biosynthesis C-methylase UbiE
MELKDNSKNKDYWNRNPMTYKPFNRDFLFPEDNSERILDNEEDFVFLNKSYLKENFYLNSFFNTLNKNNFLKDSSVLDIGCGWGSSTVLLSKYSKKITAIDISTVAIEGARKNLIFNKINNYELIEMDAENLDFENNTFDYIFSWGVIHHSADPEKIIKEIYRVLNNGGKGTIMVYNKNSLRFWLLGFYHLYFRRIIFWLQIKKYDYNWSNVSKKFTDGVYHKHYIPKKLKKEFLSLGFSEANIVINHYLGKGKILPFIKTDSILGKFLSKKFGYFLTIEFIK